MNALQMRLHYEAGARANRVERADPHLLHVADVLGCNLALRARLLDKSFLQPSVARLLQYHLGNAGEHFLAAALATSLGANGWTVERDVHLWMQWSEDGDSFWGGELDTTCYPRILRPLNVETGAAPLDPSITIVGHADLRAIKGDERIIVEAKTVDRAFPDTLSWAYQTQANMYALMAGAVSNGGSVIVGVMDRRGGEYKFYDCDPLAQLAELRDLCLRVIDTYSSDPPATVDPPIRLMCKWCDYGACSRNENPERLSLEGVA